MTEMWANKHIAGINGRNEVSSTNLWSPTLIHLVTPEPSVKPKVSVGDQVQKTIATANGVGKKFHCATSFLLVGNFRTYKPDVGRLPTSCCRYNNASSLLHERRREEAGGAVGRFSRSSHSSGSVGHRVRSSARRWSRRCKCR